MIFLIKFFIQKNSSENEKLNTRFITLDKYENFNSILLSSSEPALDLLSRSSQENLIKDLCADFDKIILSAEKNDTISLARFINDLETYHIILTTKKKTKRKLLDEICSILPMEAHLYG